MTFHLLWAHLLIFTGIFICPLCRCQQLSCTWVSPATARPTGSGGSMSPETQLCCNEFALCRRCASWEFSRRRWWHALRSGMSQRAKCAFLVPTWLGSIWPNSRRCRRFGPQNGGRLGCSMVQLCAAIWNYSDVSKFSEIVCVSLTGSCLSYPSHS